MKNIRKRRAIILYDGLATDTLGVKRDVKCYESFLRSSYGGSWKSEEIIPLNVKQYTKVVLQCKCFACSGNYLLLIYVGHGEQDAFGHTFFRVKDNKPCYICELNNYSRKQVTIVDCCRVWGGTLISESVMEKIAQVQTQTDTSAAFFDLLNQASDQRITLYACSPYEKASDACSYSYYLLNCAYLKLQEETNKYITVRRAHELAKQAMSQNTNILQTPDIVCDDESDRDELPFAISPRLM